MSTKYEATNIVPLPSPVSTTPIFTNVTVSGDVTINSGQSVFSSLASRAASGGVAFHGVAGEKGAVSWPVINTGDFAIGMYLKPDAIPVRSEITDGANNAPNIFFTSTNVAIQLAGVGSAVYGPHGFLAGNKYSVIITRLAGVTTYYRDGVVGFSNPDSNNYSAGVASLGLSTGGQNPVTGVIDGPFLMNRGLTQAEVKALITNDGVPAQADQWASQVGQTSGALVIGKRYRINTFVSGDNFTNVGGTNVSGNEFVATGTTPTTWTNASSLVKAGAIAYYPCLEGTGATAYDASTNALSLVLSGGATWANPNPANFPVNNITVAGTSTTAGITSVTDTTSASSSTVGAFTVGNGVAATSVAIGGGMINAGGSIRAGTAFYASGTHTPDVFNGTAGELYQNTTYGGCIGGYGTTNDATLFNRSGVAVFGIAANSSNATLVGTLTISGTGESSIGGSLAVGTDFTTSGQAARTFSALRNVTSNTAGNSLTLQAGGATVGATDKDGGIAYVAPGISTGTAKSSVRIQRSNRAASTGTADNALVDGVVFPSVVSMTADGSVNLFEIALPAGGMCGGFITMQITATDGTDLQVHSGHVTYAAINKGGVYNAQINDESGVDDANAASAGAITDTWAITAGTNKVTISVTVACSVITANSIKIYYTIHNGSSNVITQL